MKRETIESMSDALIGVLNGETWECRYRESHWNPFSPLDMDNVWFYFSDSLQYRRVLRPPAAWHVVDKSGSLCGIFYSFPDAEKEASSRTQYYPSSAPFRVVHTAEVAP
jgi:hypothetical protein